ncbi:MAG: fibrobacter succinogenes major paralogous domain-containing protein, partial [Prevotellaceae bacterium]|nr:fibrobacter succinogenes major paralogous domain-containing protein [Prevotellaceae bacterium]
MKQQPLLLMALAILCMAVTFNACNRNRKKDEHHIAAPPHAASDKIWVFGDQTWSDAIRVPECNNDHFELSATAPQCRSYNYEGKIYYYYNWSYVQAYAEKLCPTPWHVPTNIELDYMCKTAPNMMVELAWGFSGFANGWNLGYWGLFGAIGSMTEKNVTST